MLEKFHKNGKQHELVRSIGSACKAELQQLIYWDEITSTQLSSQTGRNYEQKKTNC